MKSKMVRVLLVIWLCAACVAAYFLIRATQKSESSLPILGRVPDFTLTTQDNRTLTLNDIKRTVGIADFFFTSCTGPCPIMSGTLAELQHKIPAGTAIHIYSFSVDPETDNPGVLRDYGRQFGADFTRWTFLTGDKKIISHITRDGFHLAIQDTDPNMILHSTKFVLIDKDAVIRGYYDSDEPKAVDQLLADAQKLERE